MAAKRHRGCNGGNGWLNGGGIARKGTSCGEMEQRVTAHGKGGTKRVGVIAKKRRFRWYGLCMFAEAVGLQW